jgi:hypothetical protein
VLDVDPRHHHHQRRASSTSAAVVGLALPPLPVVTSKDLIDSLKKIQSKAEANKKDRTHVLLEDEGRFQSARRRLQETFSSVVKFGKMSDGERGRSSPGEPVQ